MAYSTRYQARGFSSDGFFPPGVRWLLLINTALWLVYFLAARRFGGVFQDFSLMPAQVVHTFAVWQLFTYMFLHDPYGFQHILFNMLTLWMFGKDLEHAWGTRRFLKFYFVCGVGAGVCVVAANYLFGNPYTRTIGASGAIYGLLMAFGMMYPNTTVLFSFLFPIKAKYFVMIIGAMAFLSSLGANNGVSNVAHLGGMLFGYLYIRTERVAAGRIGGIDPIDTLRGKYKQWQLERNRRKFQVYMRKQGPGPWVN
jgi:membrane associated rhomboid family serine protease